MKTLLDKLKPEIIEALEENRGKYDFSITDLYEELDDRTFNEIKSYAIKLLKEWHL